MALAADSDLQFLKQNSFISFCGFLMESVIQDLFTTISWLHGQQKTIFVQKLTCSKWPRSAEMLPQWWKRTLQRDIYWVRTSVDSTNRNALKPPAKITHQYSNAVHSSLQLMNGCLCFLQTIGEQCNSQFMIPRGMSAFKPKLFVVKNSCISEAYLW